MHMKKLKRAAAIMMSAAIIFSTLPQTGISKASASVRTPK